MAVQMGIPLATLQHMTPKQQESLPQLKQRIDEIDVLLRLPDCGVSEIPAAQRSPSPEPIFDRSGMVVNTREVRKRQAAARALAVCLQGRHRSAARVATVSEYEGKSRRAILA